MADALTKINEALTIQRTAFGDDHPQLIRTMMWQGLIFQKSGDAESARASFVRARDICVSHFGEEHPDALDLARRIAQL